MKIRSFWWKESYSLTIKVSEILLCYKDKVSDESTSLCLKVIRYLFLWNVKFYDHESYSILWEEAYKEKFLISQDVSSLIQSCRLSNLS